MMTIWRLLASATPSASPMAGSAGSMMSIDSAVSAIIMATRPMNSAVDIGMSVLAAAARRGARTGAFMIHYLLVGPKGPERSGVAPVGAASGQIVASRADRPSSADGASLTPVFPRQLLSSLR